ncbi:MAG: TetR/AcrR family transcriptional regulator [Rhodospirillaceae bacterium]|jgi:TetR/AcrR family transcriptional repressor of nem operon|nr:TetR/AcrR family transcriptional regulator [Rhodospirillaceae bacterium]MBT6405165.1 TetR/AcrR family transcriptional regulator [Rhodospirillaceae bacterium]MBT6535963.1 TetR/AcrR family transcriptional regulator [Rhodospirillaceae bacterium]MBT7362419.1 TetR/AcrR family transcriptional regulator [Rhodospirillaceae bacterium]
MPRDGTITRDKILDTAEALILDQGYSATSIDKLINAVGVTKGAFFYHFDNKAALAYTLVERFAKADLSLREEFRARAAKLSRDPLQQLLIFIGLYEELMEGFDEPYPGCLFASYLYEANLFDDRTMQVIDDTYRDWRVTLGGMIDTVAETHAPKLPVDTADLADMFTGTIEGAFIMSKTLKEPKLVAAQIGLYRDFIELLFSGD